MSGLNKLMGRGILPPVVHGVLDYPLAAVLIVLPLALTTVGAIGFNLMRRELRK